MCYTSGTTGRPRGVVYSHRSSVLHALGVGANNPLGLGFGIDDAVMPVVPMFHANAWGYPYLATMQGAKLVYPGPHLDPDSLLENMEPEEGLVGGGRADDLDGDPRAARRRARPLGSLRDEGDARRRLGRAARDDRRLRGAARPEDLPGLGNDRDVARRLHGRAPVRPRRGGRRDALGLPGDGRHPAPVRRDPRSRRRRGRAVGRRGDGRARGARALGRRELLRRARDRRPLDAGRLVPHRRHRLDPPARLHPDQGPLEGRDQVGRRVDLVGRARERAHGASGRRRGGGDRRARREVGRAAARCGRARARAPPRRPTSCGSSSRRSSRSGGCPTGSSSWTRSRRRASASSARRSCASSSRPSRRRPS